jgi:hypothetical protein
MICKCPCKECISFAMCIHKEELVCSILSSWYLEKYPRYYTLLRHELQAVYGRYIPTIITSNQQTYIQFSNKTKGIKNVNGI